MESSKVVGKSGMHISSSKCTMDGVQAELNPTPQTCRQSAGSEFRRLFQGMQSRLSDRKVNITFKSLVELSEQDMQELSDEAKRFGCAPSIQLYTGKPSKITVDPAKYRKRSAGGHIHFGSSMSEYDRHRPILEFTHAKPRLAVRILDIVLGNTMVMIDRDEGQVERRKVYGKAGEYRLPPHGLEYRTLSNFWLRNYQLMSMVYSWGRFGINIGANIYFNEKQDPDTRSEYRILLDTVNKDDVEKAINTNDFDLAKSIWDKIKYILCDMTENRNFGHFPICKSMIPAFEHFIAKGLDYWFKDDPFVYWTKKHNSSIGTGWENFLSKVVETDRQSKNGISWCMSGNTFITARKLEGVEEFNSLAERRDIERNLWRSGRTLQEIAVQVGISPSTVSRDLSILGVR